MKILVTGATGFAGGHILRYLSNIYGVESVCGTGRSKSKARELLNEGYEIHIGDLLNEAFVSEYIAKFDVIIHCAAKSSLWGTYDSFYKANVVATQNIIKHTKENAQLIYISTANIYFNFSDRINIAENAPIAQPFNNHYSETKYKTEQLVLNHSKKMAVTVLRPRAIIGVGDTVVFPRILRAYSEGRLRIVGSGTNEIDFTSINNLCHAIHLCIEKKEIANSEVYNITNGDVVVLWDKIKAVLRGLGFDTNLKSVPYNIAYIFAKYKELTTAEEEQEPAMTCYGVGVLNYSINLNIDKAKKELGYEPLESSNQTLNHFIEWYKQTAMKA